MTSPNQGLVLFQTAILLLRIDDIVSGSKRQMGDGSGKAAPQASEGPEP